MSRVITQAILILLIAAPAWSQCDTTYDSTMVINYMPPPDSAEDAKINPDTGWQFTEVVNCDTLPNRSPSSIIKFQRRARRAGFKNLNPTIEIGNRKRASHEPSVNMGFWNGEVGFRMSLRTTWDSLETMTVDTMANRNGHLRRRFRTPKVTHDFYVKSAPTLSDDGVFEWEMIFHSRPDTNVFDFKLDVRGLQFHYQDSVSFADGKGVDWTDPLIGGYVFSHATKRNNFRQINGTDTTEQNYRHGGAGAILRPTVVDANGDTTWCRIRINPAQTRMRITVPKNTIRNAALPFTLGPTFGYTTPGSASSGWGPHEGWSYEGADAVKNGYAHKAAAGDAIVACSAYVKMASGTGVIVIANYFLQTDDSTASALWTRVATPIYDTINTTAQWWGNAYADPIPCIAGSLYTTRVARGSENATNWTIYRTDVTDVNGGYTTSIWSTNFYGQRYGEIASVEWSLFTQYETSTNYDPVATWSMVSQDAATGTGGWSTDESFISHNTTDAPGTANSNIYIAEEGDSVVAYGWVTGWTIGDSFAVALYVWDDSATTCLINDTLEYTAVYQDSIWLSTKIGLVPGAMYVTGGNLINNGRSVGVVDISSGVNEGYYLAGRAMPCPYGTIAGTAYATSPTVWFLIENNPTAFYKTGIFSMGTTSANDTLVITGIGFTPKLMKFTSGFSRTSDGVSGQTNLYTSYGFSDGTNDRNLGGLDWSDSPGIDKYSVWGDDALSIYTYFEMSVLSFGIGVCSLLVTDGVADFDLGWEAWGGGDIVNVTVGDKTIKTTTGTQAYTGLGYQPDMMFFGMPRKRTASGSGAGGATLSMGAASGATEEGAMANFSVHLSPTDSASSFQSTNSCLILGDADVLMVEADLESFDTDGWTLDFTTTTGTAYEYLYVAVEGGNWHVGTFDAPTSTGTDAITGVGFLPVGVSFMTYGGTGIADNSFTDGARMTWGGMDGTNEYTQGTAVTHGTTRDTNGIWTYSTKAISIFSSRFEEATPVIHQEADFSSFDSDGYTLNWGTVDADSASEIIAISFGAETAPPAGGDDFNARRIRVLGSARTIDPIDEQTLFHRGITSCVISFVR